MKHIKTVDPAEKSMRDLYKIANDDSPITAETDNLESIRKIITLTRKMDLLKLEISKETGKLMGVMQGHTSMVDPEGNQLISWKNASSKKKIDYDGLILEFNIPPDRIAAHTTLEAGARTFTIVDE